MISKLGRGVLRGEALANVTNKHFSTFGKFDVADQRTFFCASFISVQFIPGFAIVRLSGQSLGNVILKCPFYCKRDLFALLKIFQDITPHIPTSASTTYTNVTLPATVSGGIPGTRSQSTTLFFVVFFSKFTYDMGLDAQIYRNQETEPTLLRSI